MQLHELLGKWFMESGKAWVAVKHINARDLLRLRM
jgi:hypothetical protein